MTVLLRDNLRPIQTKLHGLRRAAQLWHGANGLAWLLAVTLGALLIDLGVDRLFRLDRPQRVIMLLLMAAAVGAAAWYKFIRPLLYEMSDDALCLLVERHHTNLRQSVISALQLARVDDPDRQGVSPQLLRRAVECGIAAAEPVDFSDVIDRRTRNQRLMAAAAILIGMGVLIGLFPETTKLYFSRNFAFGAAEWPQKTHLIILGVKDGELVMPRGDDAMIRVRADGVAPATVLMEINPSGARRFTRKMNTVAQDRFEVLVRNVLEPMKIRARGGDDRTEWISVRLVDRPTVEQLDLAVTPPAYTGKPARPLPPAQGAYDVLAGSTLNISGLVSPGTRRIILLDDNTPIAESAIGENDSFLFTLPPEKLHGGAYGIELRDANDLASKRPVRFSIRVFSDAPPAIRARLEGIGDLITQRATVPIVYRFTDDHAVTAADLVYQDPAAELEPNQTPPDITQSITGLDDQYGQKEIGPGIHRWQIEPLELPLGAHITFQLTATDNNVYDGPGVGRSNRFALKVVTEEELRGELLRREQEQRMEFERLLGDQKSLQVSVRAFAAGLRDDQPLTESQRNQLKELEKRQRLAAGRCSAIADHFRQSLAEIQNNKLEEEGGPMHRRMTRYIIEPLIDLADKQVPQAADHLETAARTATEAAQRRQSVDRAIESQRRMIEVMTGILANMVKVEGYHEAINLMRRILKEQGEVNEQTRKALEKEIEKIFD